MNASSQAPRQTHGRCPCCNADVLVDAQQRFGIMACPECDRIIWWIIPSEGEAPVLSDNFKHVSLDDLGGADSLDTVELIMALEEMVGHEISDEDAAKLKTLDDVAEYIDKHRKK